MLNSMPVWSGPMFTILLILWLIIIEVVSGTVFCPGALSDLSETCNSDLAGNPPEPFSFSMGPSQIATFAGNTTTVGVPYPAAFIQFTTSNPTVVRVWDAYFSGDGFQITLSGNPFPQKFPFFPSDPLFRYLPTSQYQDAYGTNLYAWTQFVLQEPSTWFLNISVIRSSSNVAAVGTYVQQFIQTFPFVPPPPPTACPFQ